MQNNFIVAALLAGAVVLLASSGANALELWPLPLSVTTGKATLQLSKGFSFVLPSNLQLDAEIAGRAIQRYEKLIAVPQTAEGTLNSCTITVAQDGVSDTDVVRADESYTLSVESDASCMISSQTIWGMMRGLETFTQLLARTESKQQVQLDYVPVSIKNDAPRFPHRGLLIDTSRHFLPLDSILHTVDALATGKLNVLHWHLVDAQSFPFDSPSEPTLVKGAYSPELAYSMADMQAVSRFAKDRGVDVVIEIDVPGHAASWTAGAPEVMADCFVKYSYNINDFALNPTKNETFSVLQNVLKDVVAATGAKRLHLGGDEVVYGCWKEDASITAYMAANGLGTNYDALLVEFVQRADALAGTAVTHWEEVFTAANKVPGALAAFPADVVFQAWTDSSTVAGITAKGFHTIVSSSDYWYLDHSDNTWQRMYDYEPTVGLSTTEAALVIGGEVTMWGEKIDQSNLLATIFPRALAVGERLWSSSAAITSTSTDSTDAAGRIEAQRCRLEQRGFAAAPLTPGFCAVSYV